MKKLYHLKQFYKFKLSRHSWIKDIYIYNFE